jgi:hypothetical protein
MGRPGDDHDLLLTRELREGFPVHLDDEVVVSSDGQ